MVNIDSIRKQAEENIQLAEQEIVINKISKDIAKLELKRAKNKEKTMKIDLDVAELMENLAERLKDLLEHKQKAKADGVLSILEEELKIGKQSSDYISKLTKIHRTIAEINSKIADEQEKIAKDQVRLADEKIDVSKVLKKLGEKQKKYTKIAESDTTSEKKKKAEEDYLDAEKKLEKEKKDVIKKEKDIMNQVNKLNETKKQLNVKKLELEKINYPTTT